MKYTYLHLFLGVMLLFSCAQQRTPTGGEKDTTAPVLVQASPMPMSTGFTGQRIELLFNEFVRLEGVREQVLISPPLEERPTFTLKGGRRLIVDLADNELEPNTTYTINFGKAIVDNNEGNVLEENVFLFSTGPYIDSLSIAGRLLEARYGDPCAGCLALLFKDVHDSLVIDSKPFYVAKADEEGYFHLAHLADAGYRLLAVRDEDADLEIDSREIMAFVDSLVRPVKMDSTGHVLRLASLGDKDPRLSYSEWALDGSYLTISFADVDSVPTLTGSAISSLSLMEYLPGNRDSLRLWFVPALEGDVELRYTLGLEEDTLRAGRLQEKEPTDLQFLLELAHEDTAATLWATSPVASIDSSRVTLFRDTVPIPMVWDCTLPAMRLSFRADWISGAYRLSLLPGALTDIYGQSHDSLEMSFACPSLTSFGLLKLNLDLPDSSDYHVELLDERRNLVRTTRMTDDGSWTIKKLSPGVYVVRVYIDEDGDGQWSRGTFSQKLLPEPVYMMNPGITVRANWELEQDVQVTFK